MASVKRDAISLKAGSMKRHGPHQDAEKSITILEWAAMTAELGSSAGAGAGGKKLEKKEPILLRSLFLSACVLVGFFLLPAATSPATRGRLVRLFTREVKK
uniref:Thioredoxin H-type 5 n=1 Tax=Arundo donax TaxID=35708 RepID=A0A0A9G4Z1_ARUDO